MQSAIRQEHITERENEISDSQRTERGGDIESNGRKYRDFGCRGILHQIVDRRTSNSSQPSLTIKQANLDILLDALFSDLSSGDAGIQQILCSDADVLAADKDLVRGQHVLVENLHGTMGEIWVRNPRSIMTSLDFAEFVRFDFVHGGGVGRGVVLDWDLSSHTTLNGTTVGMCAN